MGGTAYPFVKPQFFDDNGDPASGYQLFTYAAGTTTKQDTFSDADLTSANTNPIVLDSAGRASIFLAPQTYKFVLAPPTDTDPPAAPVWTMDDVAALSAFNPTLDVQALAGEALSPGECVHLADGSGGLTAGSWYKTDADNYYQSSTAPLLGYPTAIIPSGETGTVRIMGRVTGLSGLVAGARYYVSNAPSGAITTTRLPNIRLVGQADSSTSLVLLPGALQWRSMTIEIGSIGGTSLTSGTKKYVWFPFACLITGWSMYADALGTVEIDLRVDTHANFPPTSADTITGSDPPTMTSANKAQDLGPSGWDPVIQRDDVMAVHIETVTNLTYVSLTLELLMV